MFFSYQFFSPACLSVQLNKSSLFDELEDCGTLENLSGNYRFTSDKYQQQKRSGTGIHVLACASNPYGWWLRTHTQHAQVPPTSTFYCTYHERQER